MSTQVLERPLSSMTGDAAVDHYYCCHEDVALCGVDMRGWRFVPDDDTSPTCPLCEAAYEDKMPCPVPGCPVRPGVFSRIKRWWRSR